jgi:hypothetical protein
VWRWWIATLAPIAAAHTFHASIAQVDYITARKSLEVIIWIHAEDLERRMKLANGPRASFDKEKEAERFVREYLRTHFELKDRLGRPLPMQWVGIEVRTHFIAAYFEAPAPGGIAGVTLTNRILLAMLPDQVNTVKVKVDGKERRELVFDNRGAPKTQRLLELQSRESYN